MEENKNINQENNTGTQQTVIINNTVPNYNVKTTTINKHIFVWIGSFLFGILGVDRFMRGQIGLGILKFLTMGFPIWASIDFIIAVIKAYSTFSGEEDILFINGKYSK